MSPDDVHPHVTDSDELVALLGADLRAARDAAPLPVVGTDLAAVFSDGLPPVAAPAARKPRRSLRRTVLVGAGVLALGTGGLGVAGALPGPVQDAVSDVADVVGIDLPGAEGDAGDAEDDRPLTPVPAERPADGTSTSTSVPPVQVPRSTVPPPPPASSTVPPALEQEPEDRGRGEERREEVRPEDPGRGEADDRGDDVELEAEEPKVKPAAEDEAEVASRRRPAGTLPVVVGDQGKGGADEPAEDSSPEA